MKAKERDGNVKEKEKASLGRSLATNVNWIARSPLLAQK